jgi:hypothetical protein
VLKDLNPKRLPDGSKGYFRQSSEQIGVTATNDFIFGDLHHAMRSQLFDGLAAGSVTDAIDLGSLPDHPAVANSDTPVTLAGLAADLPNSLPTGTQLAQLTQRLRNLAKLEVILGIQFN